jgi:serine/threonine-protein kinase
VGFALNEVVGNYECLGIISKPRSGLTYKVRNLATGEVEALRALPRGAGSDAESTERLSREIRIHTRLTHPNIVGFHDAFELDGQLVMTTDFVEGPTLAQICAGRALPWQNAVATVLPVLEALEEAHALGIVHRGVTADHVIVLEGGVVKVGGFDLAKPASDTNLTKVGAVIGDPRYLSPEQIQGKQELDARSDLYAVGVLLFLALTGQMPFDGKSDIDILSAHIGAAPPRPSTLNPAIPHGLEEVVLKALRKNPEERFASAREFALALAAADHTVAPPAPVHAVTEAGPSRSSRSSRKTVVIGVIGVIVVLLVAWAVFH